MAVRVVRKLIWMSTAPPLRRVREDEVIVRVGESERPLVTVDIVLPAYPDGFSYQETSRV